MTGGAELTTRRIRFTDAGPDPDDVAVCAALVAAHETALLGVVETPVGEVNEALHQPFTDRTSSLLLLADGVPAGCLTVNRDPLARQTFFAVHSEAGAAKPAVHERAVALGVDAARRHAAELPGDGWSARSGGWIEDETHFAALEAQGFEPVRRFYQMRIASTSAAIPALAPALPDGVQLVVAADESTYRTAYDVDCRAFADHWNFTVHPFEDWRAELVDSPNRDPEGLWLLLVDGVPAGLCLLDDSRLGHREGYVAILGILREFRGRGLATLLLQRAFVRDRDRGLVGTRLGVDAENTTGAVGVYEKVGMQAARTRQGWSRTI